MAHCLSCGTFMHIGGDHCGKCHSDLVRKLHGVEGELQGLKQKYEQGLQEYHNALSAAAHARWEYRRAAEETVIYKRVLHRIVAEKERYAEDIDDATEEIRYWAQEALAEGGRARKSVKEEE